MPDKKLNEKKDCNYLMIFIKTNIFKPVNKKNRQSEISSIY